jgi:hypothetical protein
MNKQKSRFEGLFQQQDNQPEQPAKKPVTKKAPGKDIMKVRNQEKKKALSPALRLTMNSGKIMSRRLS